METTVTSSTPNPAEDLPPKYNPAAVEDRLYDFWDKGDFFHAEPGEAKPYSIVIPPPNVTGVLHMGHALNNTLQDILIRWRRMQGYNTLWMPGTDHAGIATQNVVERHIAEKGQKRHDLGREKFIEAVWGWKEEYGSTITRQLKKLGSSCDWARERFTMDEGLSAAVKEAFVRLYERDLIYKGKYIINWCPRCETALADDEVDHEDHDGHLWYIRYPFKDEPHLSVIVATTRPETMLGDTAVAVNPKDDRYREFIGETLILPVIEREIPIVADDFVDPAFGTGAVKVTPAHDPNDFQIGLRHNLPQVNVMNEDGTMNENAGAFAGTDRFECREALVEELRQKKLLDHTEPHDHAIGHCYRCHSVVEPYLSDQWFVKMKPLAEEAIKATNEGRVTFHPERWTRVYLSWLENVRDWCISRQIWWGHRIPAWYCQQCQKTIVAREAPAKCDACGGEVTQDEDVLDTWFSSALWPFSTFGWPEDTDALKFYYPTSTLITDRGIIYFWVARMVMMGHAMLDREPFADVYIHGTILDEIGRKMSKSLGNGIDPLEMIANYGSDAVRASLVLLTVEGQDVKLAENRFEMGRNFANKLWNAARFSLMNLTSGSGDAEPGPLAMEDRWIRSRLNSVTRTVTDALERFQFNEALRTLYDFAWHEFCDWYLEVVKPRLYATDEAAAGDRARARGTLAEVLDALLRLLHPFVPFITEEVWQKLKEGCGDWDDLDLTGPALIAAAWPQSDDALDAPEIESDMSLLQDLIRGVRNIRNKFGLPDRHPLTTVVSVPDEKTKNELEPNRDFLVGMGFLEGLEIGVNRDKPERSATEVIGNLQMFVPLADVIDLDAERERLEKRISKAEEQLAAVRRKLENESFVEKAPAEIVQRERDREAEILDQIEKWQQNLADLV